MRLAGSDCCQAMARRRPRRTGARGGDRVFLALVFGLCVLALAVRGAGAAQGAAQGAPESPVTIFAAASTGGAIEAAAKDFESQGGGAVRAVLAASSILARQIEQGAPADLYLSANVAWMDRLARSGAIEPGSRADLLGNTLVLVAPRERPLEIRIGPGFALAEALGQGRLAMADPNHVPAGIYAKAALGDLGIWRTIAKKAAYTNDVRAALVLVERGEAVAGIVYASDVAASRRVRVVAEFPAGSHPPIVYPLAIVRGRATPAVSAFHRYLQGPRAGAIFRAHGFVSLPKEE